MSINKKVYKYKKPLGQRGHLDRGEKMNAKEFLEEIDILNTRIVTKSAELEILNSMLFNITQQLKPDTVQTSKDQDPLGSAMAKICDMKLEISELIDEYVIRLREVIKVIEQVKDIQEYELLHMRYVQNLSWTQIAGIWDVSYQWVHEVKNDAYASVQIILDGRERLDSDHSDDCQFVR